MNHRRFAHFPGTAILNDLAEASIAFGQGAWTPIALLASRFRESWGKRRKVSGGIKTQPGQLFGIPITRRALLRPTTKENVGHHAHEPADTLL